jgi:cyclopropane fatty-acyl-phospholipid synthase-like methyltransferase
MLRDSNVGTTTKPVALENTSSVKKYLKIFGGIALSLSLATIAYLFYLSSIKRELKFNGREELSVAQMYDQDDLSSCSLFAGHFINFGFWEQPVKKGLITVPQRIESEKNLYRFVISKLGTTSGDKLLEVACGQGVGSALAIEEFKPKEMHGIDFSKAQIARAKKVNLEVIQRNQEKLFFQQGAAENMPYDSSSFDKIFSIEAAQHFENLDTFAKEANRVLKPGGKLAVASFFGTSEKSHSSLSTMIQTIRDGIDKATPIHQFEEILKKNGFKNIKIESIGKNVWYGFDQWTAQGDLKDSWTRNWYKGYQEGLIDYYLITAEKSN